MGRVPDREKLRKDYLKRKCKLTTLELIAMALCLPSFCVAMMLVVITICFVGVWATGEPFGFTGFSISLLMLIGCISIVRWSWKTMDHVDSQFKELQYFPPVTVATLPAEEVLVRGIGPPAVAEEDVLLRSAQAQETVAGD